MTEEFSTGAHSKNLRMTVAKTRDCSSLKYMHKKKHAYVGHYETDTSSKDKTIAN